MRVCVYGEVVVFLLSSFEKLVHVTWDYLTASVRGTLSGTEPRSEAESLVMSNVWS